MNKLFFLTILFCFSFYCASGQNSTKTKNKFQKKQHISGPILTKDTAKVCQTSNSGTVGTGTDNSKDVVVSKPVKKQAIIQSIPIENKIGSIRKSKKKKTNKK